MKIVMILALVLIVAITGGATIYFLSAKKLPIIDPTGQIKALALQVVTLQSQVTHLQKSVDNLNPVATDSAVGEATHNKVSTLETSVTDLQTRVKALENQMPVKLSSNTTSSPKPPLYVSIGSSGQSTSTQYQVLDTPQIAIDPNDYPGYTSMQLEISLQVDQGNGQASAMLYEVNEGQFIPDSEVSTTKASPDLLASKTFTLPNDKKTYRIALKTTTGYTVSFQDAKLRVNF